MRNLTLLLVVLASAMGAQPVVTGAANALSFQPTFSAGSLAVVAGTGLVATGSTTTVTVAGKAAYVWPQGIATQLTVELPVDLATGATTLIVTVGTQASAPFALSIGAYAPALTSANGSGSGPGLFYTSSYAQIAATNQATPGQTLIAVATGLGVTNPALPTGVAPTGTETASTVAPVTVTVGGVTENATFAGEVPSVADGVYQVNITIPKTASDCAVNVVLTVGGISSPPVTVPIVTPSPTLCAVENAATGLVRDATHGAAANSFIAVYAANLGGASTNNLFPATSNQGIEVNYNGTPLPLYSVTSLSSTETLVNTALPANAGTSGTGTITVTNSTGTSSSYTIELAPTDVGVFRLPDANDPTRIQGVVLLANSYWFAMPASLATEYNLPPCTGLPATSPCGQPAAPGSQIVIYFTGGGLATPDGAANGTPLAPGAVAPIDGSVIYETVTAPTVTIGGITATVLFSGIAPGTAAEYQINTTIPMGVQSGNDVPIVINMGATSTDMVTIAVAAQ